MGTIQAPPGVSIPAVLLPLLQAMAQTDTTFPSSSPDFFVDGKINFSGYIVQSASISGGQRCAAPREVGGTNDVTVSNRVNLVDPIIIHNY